MVEQNKPSQRVSGRGEHGADVLDYDRYYGGK
jgi:hypothetical protein